MQALVTYAPRVILALIQKSVHRQQFIPQLFPLLKVLAVWVVTCLLIAWNQHYKDLIDLWCY